MVSPRTGKPRTVGDRRGVCALKHNYCGSRRNGASPHKWGCGRKRPENAEDWPEKAGAVAGSAHIRWRVVADCGWELPPSATQGARGDCAAASQPRVLVARSLFPTPLGMRRAAERGSLGWRFRLGFFSTLSARLMEGVVETA